MAIHFSIGVHESIRGLVWLQEASKEHGQKLLPLASSVLTVLPSSPSVPRCHIIREEGLATRETDSRTVRGHSASVRVDQWSYNVPNRCIEWGFGLGVGRFGTDSRSLITLTECFTIQIPQCILPVRLANLHPSRFRLSDICICCSPRYSPWSHPNSFLHRPPDVYTSRSGDYPPPLPRCGLHSFPRAPDPCQSTRDRQERHTSGRMAFFLAWMSRRWIGVNS
ncbi:hypothetical protein BDM02DRAFT_835625 [Thelephora ganbajun]|uniref:Uncharacterized protein n=1 Tax=Thelephora ganbajun TaxID=370292 RepID=A0ACB6Z5K7_THEGA|nr:hypothetical protein BDM02DRAFT_835625 [Thelephora ganbajun]